MELDRQRREGLWRRYRLAAAGPASARPDLPMLAAYLDGGLDEAGREQVEAWLVADPALLDLALAAADSPAAREPWRGRRRATPFGLLPGLSWAPAAALAASVAFAALLGFELGRQASDALATVEDAGSRPIADLIDRSDSMENFL